MTWIFDSFLVTPCALISCQVVISKQGDESVMTVRSNRCVTGRRPRENHAVRFRQFAENRVEPGTRSRSKASWTSLTTQLAKWVQASAPPGSLKKIGDKKKSPIWVYVSPSISQTNNKVGAPFENKMRERFL